MPIPVIRIFKNLDGLSREAAVQFSRAAREDAQARGLFSTALSGGHTPKRFYEFLATPEFLSVVPWERVQMFQVDERCVPPDDPHSNYRMIYESLLSRIPGGNFHRMAAEQPDREAAAAAYAEDLRKTLPSAPDEWPRLDLALLGMGPDGHTASLFPGTAALNERRRAVCPNWVEKLGMWRLTLTLPVLNAAARVIFLVAGEDKAHVLADVLRPSGPAPQLPAQLVEPAEKPAEWYLDEAAARLL
ncbi:MAG: 6-phosphogluconolactonase [Terriglobia bacterium]